MRWGNKRGIGRPMWRSWWAWYPVKVANYAPNQTPEDCYPRLGGWAWLEYVEYGYWGSRGNWIEYRETPK